MSFVCLLQHCLTNSLDSGPLYCNHSTGTVDLLTLEQMRAGNASKKFILVYHLSKKTIPLLFQQIVKSSTVALNEKSLHPSFAWLKKKDPHLFFSVCTDI